MKREYIARALADTYHQAAMEGKDMRRVADQLENLRLSIEEKTLYQAWRDVDRSVGQALWQKNQELFELLNSFRTAFVQWAFESARVKLQEGFVEDRETGWKSFLTLYVESLTHWRHQIYTELSTELDLEAIEEEDWYLYLEIAKASPYMLEARWDQTYPLFLTLAELSFIPTPQRAQLLCSAGQIQLYFLSDMEMAGRHFEEARSMAGENQVALARVEQSLGELHLFEMRLDEARDCFQKALTLDPQNEFALLYMGDTYREEGRHSIAEAWYGDAQALFPGGTDVLIRFIRLFEKRDYFSAHDPVKIREYTDWIGQLAPLEQYSSLLDAGFAFQSNDLFEEAESWYRQAIALNPARVGAWVNLGYVLDKKQVWEDAVNAFQQALEIDPDYFDAQWGLAFLYESNAGTEELAIQIFETARRLRPQWELFIQPRISELLLRLGKEEEANALLLECLGKFPEKDADPLRILHERLDRYVGDEAKEETALALLEKIRQIKGTGYEVTYYNRAANIKYSLFKNEEAADLYLKTIEIDPSDPENYNRLGIIYYRTRSYEEAVKYYLQAIERSPLAIYYENLGLCYEELGQEGLAVQAYENAIEQAPEMGQFPNRLGLFYYNRQRHAESIPHYEKAVSLEPENAIFHNNLALALEATGRIEEAEPFYQKAIEMDPYNPVYTNYLGGLYFRAQRYEEAEACFAKSVELNPEVAFYHENLGLACEMQGKFEEAEKAFQGALATEPGTPVYLNRLGLYYYNRAQYQESIPFYEKALEKDPDNPIFIANLGLACLNIQDAPRAITLLEQALSLDPENAAIRQFLDVAKNQA